MPGDPTGTIGSTAALRVTVRRYPRTGADLHPPGVGAGAMAFPLSCRPGLARHLRRRSSRYRALGAGVGAVTAENPKADLEIPHHGPTQRWPAQLCIGPTAVLGDSRVASRRQWRRSRRATLIVFERSTTHQQPERFWDRKCNGDHRVQPRRPAVDIRQLRVAHGAVPGYNFIAA